jgi:hypothetical protein
MKETKTYYKLIEEYPNSPKLGTILCLIELYNNDKFCGRGVYDFDTNEYYSHIYSITLNSKFYEKSVKMTDDGYPLFHLDEIFYLNIYGMGGKYIFRVNTYKESLSGRILFKLEENYKKSLTFVRQELNKPKLNLIQNISKFPVGTIVTKVVQREFERYDYLTFTPQVVSNIDRSYMEDIYKLVGFGNNFAYLEQLSGYQKNKLIKIEIDRYGEGWQKVDVPNGMSLEQICAI